MLFGHSGIRVFGTVSRYVLEKVETRVTKLFKQIIHSPSGIKVFRYSGNQVFRYSCIRVFGYSGIQVPPPPIPGAVQGRLKSILYVPNVPVDKLTVPRQKNYNRYIAEIREDLRWGHRDATIVTMEIDRSGENWGSTYHFDAVQSIRCKGPDIFVMTIPDMDLPFEDRCLHRFLTIQERFRLIGYKASVSGMFKSKRAALKASGNAYTVPMMASAILPLVRQAIQSGVITPSHQKAKSHSELFEMAASKRRRLSQGSCSVIHSKKR